MWKTCAKHVQNMCKTCRKHFKNIAKTFEKTIGEISYKRTKVEYNIKYVLKIYQKNISLLFSELKPWSISIFGKPNPNPAHCIVVDSTS